MADGEAGRDIERSTQPSLRVAVHNEGDEQFVVLPQAFHFAADEVSIRRDGDRLVLEAAVATPAPQTDAEWADFWREIDGLRGESRLVMPQHEPDDSDVAL